MPMFKVYVGNIDDRTTVETLKPYFEPFGDAVDEIIVALDAEGQPRGFAIVLFRDAERGQLAIETLTGKRINGREIQINEAVKKGKRTKPVERAPRNSPLGPRAFQRPGAGGGSRPGPGGGRPSSRPGGGRPGFSASAGGPSSFGGGGSAGRFNRNPRRLPGQGPSDGAAGPRPTGSAPGAAPGPGSRSLGGGPPSSSSRPLGGGMLPRPGAPRPPVPGGSTSQSRPLGGGPARPPLPGTSRPLGAPPSARPPVPPAGGTPSAAPKASGGTPPSSALPSDAPAAGGTSEAPAPRARAKKKPSTDA